MGHDTAQGVHRRIVNLAGARHNTDMQRALLVLPIILPVLFWAVYHYHKDRHLPEPPTHLLLALLLGLLAAGVSQSLYLALEPLGLRHDAGYLAETNTLGLLAYSLLAIGPIEEFSKMLFFVLVVLRFKEFDEPLDGIIYASFIGLGYAAIENWQYLEYLTPLEATARGFASPVIHIVFASIWGHWIGRAFVAGRSILPAVLIGFSIAAVLHGLYDFMTLVQPYSALPFAAALIIAIWIWRLRVMHRLHRQATTSAAKTER
jgi:RsiW-degrading membrane proteinase PrsW (M82 family)